MVTKRDKKKSGQKVTKLYDPVNEPYEEKYYDDWSDWRDGQRELKRHSR